MTCSRASASLFLAGLLLGLVTGSCRAAAGGARTGPSIRLNPPSASQSLTVEQALAQRRSVRSYEPEPLTLREVSQLLWAAQGITDRRGHRTAPSAGATYPLECYLVAGKVESLAPGVYRYLPRETAIVQIAEGDKRGALTARALFQRSIAQAPASIVIAADLNRTVARYLKPGRRFVYMEVGHCAQNIALEAEALGLGSVCIGAFDAGAVGKLLGIREEVSYILPVGRPRKGRETDD